jgi:hypothetical protein
MAITLTDDGTLDTVVRCDDCGEEFRYNFDIEDHAEDCTAKTDDSAPPCTCYDAFVEWCIIDAANAHDCVCQDDEPQEDDLTTGDHERFYQNGKLVIEGIRRKNEFEPYRFLLKTRKGYRYCDTDDYRQAVRVFMAEDEFWPNVWFISDHGNAHLITL